MTENRVLALATIAFGALLLLWLIPANVTAVPGSVMDPALFPEIAAWLLIGLGAIQLFVRMPQSAVPPLMVFARFALVATLTLAAVLLMPQLGYIVTSAALMALLALLVFERRLVWLAVTVAALPVGVWAFFELVLRRPLP